MSKKFVIAHQQIGPDAIKYLCDLSQDITGNRYRFYGMHVQFRGSGSPNRPVLSPNPNAMEFVGAGHPASYGRFIHESIIPAGEIFAAHLGQASREGRVELINEMLAYSRYRDSHAWWVMSTNAVRRYLFPSSYDPHTAKRIDRLSYRSGSGVPLRGSVIPIHSLTAAHVDTFLERAEVATGGNLEIDLVDPFSKPIQSKQAA